MKNAKIIVLAAIFIFLISGSYALYVGDNALDFIVSDETQNNDQNSQINVSNDDENQMENPIDNNQKADDNVKSPVITVDSVTQKYAIKYAESGKYLSLNDSHIDMFIQCICGRFAPYGEVSKQLPAEALCPYIQNNYIGTGDLEDDHAYTYDEAMKIWQRDRVANLASIKEYTDLGLDIHSDDLPEEPSSVSAQPYNTNDYSQAENTIDYSLENYG